MDTVFCTKSKRTEGILFILLGIAFCCVFLVQSQVGFCPPPEEQEDPRPRLFLLPGPRKTGTSAFYDYCVRNPKALSKEGFIYPNVPGHTFKNGAHFFPRCRSLSQKYRKQAEQAGRESVIVSSDQIFIEVPRTCEALYTWHQELCKNFHPTLVLVVREVWEWYWSHIMQAVKFRVPEVGMDVSFKRDDWLEMGDMFSALPLWLETFENHKLINYTKHKRNFVEEVCTRMGISFCANDHNASREINRSLTLSEFNLFNRLHETRAYTGGTLHKLFLAFAKRAPHKPSFRYYDAEQAGRLYDKLRPVVEHLNGMYLSEEDQLPTKPFQPEGYVTEWDQTYVEKADLDFAARVLKKKLGNLGLKPR